MDSVTRIRVAYALRRQGIAVKEIACEVGRDRATVYRWLKSIDRAVWDRGVYQVLSSGEERPIWWPSPISPNACSGPGKWAKRRILEDRYRLQNYIIVATRESAFWLVRNSHFGSPENCGRLSF
jgi:hypothetical protein